MEREERIKIAQACRDSDVIPKVEHAGEIIDDGKGKPYQLMHNGIKVYTDSHYGDFNSKIIQLLRGHHEPQEELVFYEVLQSIAPGSVMLECGSFWAYYSMWFKSKIPGSLAYMIEPMPYVMKHGIDNFELNNMSGDFTSACVGSESKESVSFKDWDAQFYDIRQIAVDDFLNEKKIDYLAILHADIQGAEFDMLNGALESLKSGRIGYVFISTHSEELHFKCLRLLKKCAYNIISEHTLEESYSTDGLIVASYRSIPYKRVKVSGKLSAKGVITRIRYFFK